MCVWCVWCVYNVCVMCVMCVLWWWCVRAVWCVRVCVFGGVWCVVCCTVRCGVCADSVCRMCVVCFGVCGVCAWCVVCVARLGTRKNLSPFFLFLRSLPSFSFSSLSARISFFLSLSLLVSLFVSVSSQLSVFLFSMTMAMTMIARPVGSLCTHGSDLPECQSAWAAAPSL